MQVDDRQVAKLNGNIKSGNINFANKPNTEVHFLPISDV